MYYNFKNRFLPLLVGLCSLLILTSSSAAQFFNTNLDTDVGGWITCIHPNCDPGGVGTPTSTVIQSTGSVWPPNSLQVQLTGPDSTNALWYHLNGVTTSTYFEADLTVYVSKGLQSAQALEYDIFQYLTPFRYMWGSECVFGGVWDVWSGLAHTWVHTSIPCKLSVGWHHLQLWVHRLNGDFSCQGFPCLHYDTLGVDNVYYSLNTTEPSEFLHAGWSDQSGLNVQIDLNRAGTLTEYLRKVNLIGLN